MTMKGLMKVITGPGNVELREIDIPVLPDDNWVLIKVKACGLCMTDIHVLHETFRNYPPIVLGHELSGVIEKVGGAVKHFKVGQHVVTECKTGSCGVCPACQQGRGNFCSDRRGPGWGINGGMTDYIVMPENTLHPVPDEIPFDVAALAEPMSCAVAAMDEIAGFNVGDVVLVSGCGPIGMLAAFVAKAGGASKVILTGLNKSEPVRFKVAKELGIDYIINVEKEDLVARVMEITDGKGADLVVETSGVASAIQQAVASAAILGRIVGVGFNGDNSVAIEWNTCIYKGLALTYSFSSTYTAFEKAVRLMGKHVDELKKIVTTRCLIDDFEEVFDRQLDELDIKVMFIPESEIYAYE